MLDFPLQIAQISQACWKKANASKNHFDIVSNRMIARALFSMDTETFPLGSGALQERSLIVTEISGASKHLDGAD